MSATELRTVKSESLCSSYALKKGPRVRAELERRADISAEDWRLIESKSVSIGMTELALLCSWGYPPIGGDINESVGSWGVHRQWVYRACTGCKAQYVYTENGKVASWQH